MTYQALVPDDFAAYLGTDIDADRAEQILRLSEALCTSVVSPLPDGAEVVVLDVATRAFTNPTSVQASSTGPYTTSYSASSGGVAGGIAGGLYLTKSNKRTLRRLANHGGAFSISMLPETAGQGLPWWDAGTPFPSFDEPPL